LFVPILIAFGAAVVGGIGAKKGYDGVDAMVQAKAKAKAAREKHDLHVRQLEAARGHLNERLDSLRRRAKTIDRETFARLFAFLESLDQKARAQALAGLEEVGVTHEHVAEITLSYISAGGVVSGAMKSALAGGVTSAAATGLVTTFGTASTGAAISGLSGAAAESAMLAFLGGGSLATGGGGMALGGVVLGGIAVAPAVCIGGIVLAKQGQKALTQACEYSAKVDSAVAAMESCVHLMHQGEKRVHELRDLMNRLDQRVVANLDWLRDLGRFDPDDESHIRRFAVTMQLAKALRAVMHASIFDSEGALATEFPAIISQQSKLLESA
jgi:hypothetical protein